LIDLHQERINATYSQFFPTHSPIKLRSILPEISGNEKRKVRLIYDSNQHKIEVQLYKQKNIDSLKLIIDHQIHYAYKYEDRNQINRLLHQFPDFDDIIVIVDNCITDSSYANLTFWNGQKWVTPSTYLLNGVKRQHLLNNHKIIESTIHPEDIQQFEKVSLINAMLDPGELCLDINKIS
tara:strand:+ start:107 stop:646 length:540 start_codon:yes stop_codon:yes gene_type:complete